MDWISRVVYWLESSAVHNAIMAASIEGKYKKTIISSDLHKPRSLAVDPIRG